MSPVKRIAKNTYQGTDSLINARHFHAFGRTFLIAKSETVWYDKKRHPNKKPKFPVWVSDIKGETPTLFIKKIAMGFKKNPKPSQK